MNRKDWGLETLLKPLSLKEFAQEYWTSKPCVASRGEHFFADLFSTEDFEQLITSESLPASSVHLADSSVGYRHPGTYLRPDGSVDPVKVFEGYAAGATVVINYLRAKSPSLLALCRAVERDIAHPVNLNCYMTPRSAQGLEAHTDPHEVLVLQIEGKKFWKVYERQTVNPFADQRHSPQPEARPVMEVELGPGDVLYLPSGYPHECLTSRRSSSVHLTLGITCFRWLDLLTEVLRVSAATAAALRAPLPLGVLGTLSVPASAVEHAETLFKDALRNADVQGALQAMGQQFRGRRRLMPFELPNPTSQFRQIDRVDNLKLASRVTNLYPDQAILAPAGDGSYRLSFPGSSCLVSKELGPAVEYMLKHDQFQMRDLPLDGGEDANFVLVGRLLTLGFLQADI